VPNAHFLTFAVPKAYLPTSSKLESLMVLMTKVERKREMEMRKKAKKTGWEGWG
jgi:hypothetical protein